MTLSPITVLQSLTYSLVIPLLYLSEQACDGPRAVITPKLKLIYFNPAAHETVQDITSWRQTEHVTDAQLSELFFGLFLRSAV